MGNKDRGKLIRIYGVTLAEEQVRPYGHGTTKLEIEGEEVMVAYVDYFIDDLIALIHNQDLTNKFMKKLKNV